MASKSRQGIAQIEKRQRVQLRLLKKLEKKEDWMKWLIIGLAILLLLFILFFGYATDWTRGLKRDSAVNNPATTNIAETDAVGNPIPAREQSTTSRTTDTGNSSTTGTNAKESTNTSTHTTTNNSTTDTTTGKSALTALYEDTGVGDDVNNLSSLVGVSQECHNEVFIQVCEFTDGSGQTITTKNLLGSGIITSITRNFE